MRKTTMVLPTLIFATGNAGKAKEVGQLLDGIMEVKSLKALIIKIMISKLLKQEADIHCNLQKMKALF